MALTKDLLTYKSLKKRLALTGRRGRSGREDVRLRALGNAEGSKGSLSPVFDDPYRANLLLYEGEHYHGGDGWTGAMPPRSDTGKYNEARKRIRRSFVSQNMIRECTDRHLDGILGGNPTLGVDALTEEEATGDVSGGDAEENTDTAQEQRERVAARIEAALRRFWNDRDVLEEFRAAAKSYLLAGRGPLRYFVPPAALAGETLAPFFEALEQGGEPESGAAVAEDAESLFSLGEVTFEKALESIFPDAPGPESAGVLEHETSMSSVGVYIFEPERDDFSEDEDGYVMLSFLDPDGNTRVARVDGEDVTMSDPFEMDGHLLELQIEGEPLISEQVRQQQLAHNKTLTTANVNTDWASFLERIFLNAQQPKEAKRVRDRETGEMVEIEEDADYEAGPTQSTFLQGTVLGQDEEGNYEIATPQVKFREPLDPSKFEGTSKIFQRSLLHEVRQAHVIGSQSDNSSGEALLQYRDEFRRSLKGSKKLVDALGREFLQGVYMFARALAGKPEDLPPASELQWTFECRLDAGRLTPDEMRVIIERVEKGLLSVDTALALMGIEDVASELERIRAGEMSELAQEKKRADIAQVYAAAGLSIRQSLIAAGMEEDRARKLAAVTEDDSVEQ